METDIQIDLMRTPRRTLVWTNLKRFVPEHRCVQPRLLSTPDRSLCWHSSGRIVSNSGMHDTSRTWCTATVWQCPRCGLCSPEVKDKAIKICFRSLLTPFATDMYIMGARCASPLICMTWKSYSTAQYKNWMPFDLHLYLLLHRARANPHTPQSTFFYPQCCLCNCYLL